MSVAVERPRTVAQETTPSTPAVKMWALGGAVVVVFVLVCLVRWVTGPFFERVPSGPSQPPTWMKVELIGWQIITIPLALYFLNRYVIRPYRLAKTFGTDGIIVLGSMLMWFQDPLSSATNHWFVYNTWMVNFGSWANSTPGFAAFGKPGAMSSEPILFTPAAYTLFFMLGSAVGCLVMRRAAARWPRLTTGGLVGVCLVSMMVFDVIAEGLIWMPLGIYEYPGGHWSIFADTYHKYPLNEMLTLGTTLTVVSCLRYFKNDKGQSFVERGVDKVRGSEKRRLLYRALAGIAAMQLIMFAFYNLPNAILALKADPWPKDLQERSYFTNRLCGAGTDRLCPGPDVSTYRNGASYVNSRGQAVFPTGTQLPPTYPFKP